MYSRRTCMLICMLLALALVPMYAYAGALTGKVIGISPGHGREWGGSGWQWERPQTCAPLTNEDLHNIDIAAFLNAYLLQDGATVKCYRCIDKNYGPSPFDGGRPWWEMGAAYWLQHLGYPVEVYANATLDPILGAGESEYSDTVRSRALASNYDNADILIGIHTNAATGSATGTEIIYEGTQPVHQPWWDSSRQLCEKILSPLIESIQVKYGDAGWSNRGVKEDADSDGNYYETMYANCPVVLLELAFHDNCTRDALYLRDNFFLSTTMWATYKGICDFFGVTPTYDYYSCELVSSDIPTRMLAGQTVPVHITLRNRGVLWTEARQFRLASTNPTDPFTTQTRQILGTEVWPNEEVTFTFDLTAPMVLGPYQTSWQMTREGVAWFGPVISQNIQVVDTSEDTTPPTTPTGLTAAGASPTQIYLSWTASTDDFAVAGYEVYRDGAPVGLTRDTYYYDTGLLPGTTHTYQVRAYDGGGNNSPLSDPASATTFGDATPPAAPTDLVATGVHMGQIDLTWTAPYDQSVITNYKVYRNGVHVGSPTGTSYSDTGLTSGTSYIYQVSAVDSFGNVSNLSAPAVGRTLAYGETVIWSDDFESYVDQSAFEAAWPGLSGYSPLTWSAARSFSPTHGVEETSSARGSAHGFTAGQSGISVGSFYEFKFYDPGITSASVRHFGTIRSYTGGGYNNGSLSELLSIGCNSGQTCSNSYYNGRSANGVGNVPAGSNGWFDLTIPRSGGWHTMRIDVVSETSDPPVAGEGMAVWSVDGVVGAFKPIKWKPFTCVTIGSAATSSTAGSYYYDDVKYGFQSALQRVSGPNAVENPLGSVTITWKTDLDSTSRVDYGTTTDYGQFVFDGNLTKNHSVTITNLAPATVYHFKVTSTASGKTDSVSEDYTFSTAAASLAQLKELEDGRISGANGLVVSAVLMNGFYVQDADRTCGFKILGTANADVGSLVNVIGRLDTVDGERVLQDAIVTPVGTGDAPMPLGLTNKAIGGAGIGINIPGITNAMGANNIGLLVKVWGKVTATDTGVFWIDDGSGMTAADGKKGIKVSANGLDIPEVDDIVVVTGISGAESISDAIWPVLRMRTNEDLVTVSQ